MATGKDEWMNTKLLGAILIIAACGGFGFKLVANYKYEERTLGQLTAALDFMSCELQYRLTPLPMLCRQTAAECKGILADIFLSFAIELEDQISPDANCCMLSVLAKFKKLPQRTIDNLELLGNSLGRFDLEGQLKGLESVRQSCRVSIDNMNCNKDIRLRGYQTLALCAGAALVILFI